MYILRPLFLFSCISIGIMACNEDNESTQSGTEPVQVTTQTGRERTTTSSGTANTPKVIKSRPATDMIATNSKLEGGWISDKDEIFQILFKGSEYAEYRNGKLIRKGTYQLTDCKNNACADCKPMPTCLILKINGKEICNSILIADGVDLRLGTTGAGTLEFHRN